MRCAACRAEVAGDEEAAFSCGWIVDDDGEILCPDCAVKLCEETISDGD